MACELELPSEMEIADHNKTGNNKECQKLYQYLGPKTVPVFGQFTTRGAITEQTKQNLNKSNFKTQTSLYYLTYKTMIEYGEPPERKGRLWRWYLEAETSF